MRTSTDIWEKELHFFGFHIRNSDWHWASRKVPLKLLWEVPRKGLFRPSTETEILDLTRPQKNAFLLRESWGGGGGVFGIVGSRAKKWGVMGERENLPFNEEAFSTSVRWNISLVKSAHFGVFYIFLSYILSNRNLSLQEKNCVFHTGAGSPHRRWCLISDPLAAFWERLSWGTWV